jgi:hypothetical protein
MIDPIHTSCKNCIFSEYVENTQTDCNLKYIEKHKNNDIEIIEAYDEEKNFYIINKKKCIGYRDKEWLKSNDLSISSSIEDKIHKYQELNFIQYIMVVDLKNVNTEQFIDVCKQISELKTQPQKIIFIRYTNNDLSFPYNFMKEIVESYPISSIWRIQTMIDNSMSYEDILHTSIVTNPQYRFIYSVTDYDKNIGHIITIANQIVHDDLKQFNVLSNATKTCIIFSSSVYRYSLLKEQKNILLNEELYKFI